MPINIKDNWYFPGVRSLQDLVTRSSQTKLDEFEDQNAIFNIYNCPPHIRDRFKNIIRTNYATNYVPGIMHPKAGAKFEGELKLNVKFLNNFPRAALAYEDRDFYNSNYSYLDDYLGKRRLNIVSNYFQEIRINDSSHSQYGSKLTLTQKEGVHAINNAFGHDDAEHYSYINLIQGHNVTSRYQNFDETSEIMAVSPELFVSQVAFYYKKPVTYHVYEDDIVLRSDAHRSKSVARYHGGYSSAGMRRRDAGKITGSYGGRSRSLLAGAEYNSALWEI